MNPTALASPDVRAQLHELAARVADDLDRGAVARAWARTRELERAADPRGVPAPATPVPPAPVVGRRFAAAHRRLLGGRADGEVCRDPAA
ncbi:hypothetical protein [Egicoccus sp. AB-alg6-2]|uniref:hypothetical protein n=1 Tax=Egicoccus sp. AB-alg6-2 TaxID=3242692 RepID=UPI00359CE72C